MRKIIGRVRKKEVAEVESSDEEEVRSLAKVVLEAHMMVKIHGTKHYMTNHEGIHNLIFSYPEGRLKGQYIEESQEIEPIDLE